MAYPTALLPLGIPLRQSCFCSSSYFRDPSFWASAQAFHCASSLQGPVSSHGSEQNMLDHNVPASLWPSGERKNMSPFWPGGTGASEGPTNLHQLTLWNGDSSRLVRLFHRRSGRCSAHVRASSRRSAGALSHLRSCKTKAGVFCPRARWPKAACSIAHGVLPPLHTTYFRVCFLRPAP